MISKIIKIELIILLLCCLFITSSLASQTINFTNTEKILQNNPFNFNLFGAITYLPKNKESFLEFITEGKDHFYEIGLQTSYYFGNAFSFNGQVSKHGAEDLDIDFLTLKYSNSVNDCFSYNAEIGKIRLNMGFLSAGRLNPKYRWSIILPQTLYSNNVKRFTSGGWGLSFKPMYIFENNWGVTTNFAFFKPSKSSDETLINAFYGPLAEGTYETGKGIIINTQFFSPIEKYQFYYTFGYIYDDLYTPSYMMKEYNQELILNQIGFRYNINNFSWLIEARHLHIWNDFYSDIGGEDKHQEGAGLNVATRYWINKNIVMTIFGYGYWTDKIGDWDGQEKAESLGTDKYSHIQHDFYTTLVYKFNKYVDFKLEYHRMIGSSVVNGESNDMKSFPHEWDIVATQISFNF